MGRATSKPLLLSEADGDASVFNDQFVIDHKLGEGKFCVVNLIRERSSSPSDQPPVLYAAKVLRKDVVYKGNTIHTPRKPDLLKRECNILRALQGQHFTLVLRALFESKSTVFIVTEYCAGGMMMDYLAACYGATGLSTLDVSRISFQLLDAVRHCADCGVIHRDIKPENIMFTHSQRGAELRLIDFGCGALDTGSVDKANFISQSDGTILQRHATYVGTPFYTSPEVFQRSYSNGTDVWSAAVTLYVLVAGYPSDKLQKAFDMLHKNNMPLGGRQDMLKTLPHMPPNLPDSFFDVLDMCLVYNHKHRKSAKDICLAEFLQLHRKVSSPPQEITQSLGQVAADSTLNNVFIEQCTQTFAAYLQYGIFERSVIGLLATTLDQEKLMSLIQALDMLLQDHLTDEKLQQRSPSDHKLHANKRRLQIVRINELFAILKALELEYWYVYHHAPPQKNYRFG